jgi:hypothetical protein
LEKNVALFLKLSQNRRRIGVILLSGREIIVGIWGSVRFGEEFMRVELSTDEGFVEVGVSLEF